MCTYGDVLLDEPGDLHGLVSLDPGDALLHEVAALHVEVEDSVLGLHLAGGDDLGEGVVEDGLVGDQVEEVNSVFVESEDVFTALHGIAVSADLRKMRS